MNNATVSINLVVLNGEKYIRHCLDSILAQTYPHELIELNILDNGSTDKTKEVIGNWKLVIGNSSFASFNLIESQQNLGMWPGQEELLKHSSGKYVLAIAVDVILDKDFVANAVKKMETDSNIGALEAKIYKFDALIDIKGSKFQVPSSKIIDTCGFQIFKSRRVVNIGHGEIDNGQFNEYKEIFGVEGAAPFFRREALESCRITEPIESFTKGGPRYEIFDHDYFWYGDDLDIAWRMRIFGWRQLFVPDVIAWHDRQTTKNLRKTFADFLKIRKQLPLQKRRLEWRNIRFTIIKNDYTINILKDLPYILKREIMMLGYIIIFEPKVLGEVPAFLRILPKILKKRKQIMKRKVAGPEEMRKWFR